MRRRNAFTLIELLVVIAIISILAAIIFPVYAQAKKSAYRSSDISNMNSLRTALQLYKADNESYPPALLGYVNLYENVDGAGNIVPPGSVKGALYPKRLESISILRPALNRTAETPTAVEAFNATAAQAGNSAIIVPAVWPNGILGGAAGDARQRFGPSAQVQHAVLTSGGCQVVPSYFYRVSGYDVAQVEGPGGRRFETHYRTFWTGWTVPADPCNVAANESGSASDNPRQLGYAEPPETTVVTWDTYFRDYQGGSPIRQRQDIVLFLGGAARPVDSVNMATQAWAVTP